MDLITFFDTETTGKLINRLPPENPQQPDIVQIAAVMIDEATLEDEHPKVYGEMNFIVHPSDCFTIPDEAAKIHGITTEIARFAGQPRRTVLSAFNHLCKASRKLVAHNLEFDYSVCLTAYHREGVPHRFNHLKVNGMICSMKVSIPVLKLPKPNGWRSRPGDEWKWPTLTECHQHFFSKAIDGAHNATNDVWAMIRVCGALRRIGAL